ncbi:MAG: AAA family ATPase, partial [Myxococcales bacterium]|nr:AAA family ATPase [Myxococcales bacterium]
MLACLRVRNFAIIDALEVEFGPGLNVVTGETGAGKSILVHALELVLGGRARPDVIRTGAADAEVEALFEIGADSALRVRLLEAGIDVDDELVIRRIVAANGRTRAYVGGKLTTARQLASLALGLTDICSQHEHHSLVDPSSHLGYLDAFAQNAELLSEMSVRHGALAEAQGALDALIGAGKERAEREDLLRFQLQEIDDLEPREGERSELERERQRLRHLERLGTVAGGAEEALYAEDGSICDGLSRIGEQVREACRLDPSLEGTATELEEALALVQDAAAELGRYARTLTMEPGRLEVIEERLDRLGRLERKHGGSFEALLAFAAQAREELACLEDLEGSLARAQAERDSAQEAAREAAQGLRERRKAAAGRLASSIRRELRSLGMGDAEVKVELSERGGGGAPAESRALLLDGAQLS